MNAARILTLGLLTIGAVSSLSGCLFSSDKDNIVTYSQSDDAVTRRSDVEKPDIQTNVIQEAGAPNHSELSAANDQELEDLELSFASLYFMENMTDEERLVYKQFIAGVRDFQTSIPLTHGVLTSDSFYDMMVMAAACEPCMDSIELSYTINLDGDGKVTSVEKLQYLLTPNEYAERNYSLNVRIQEILAGMDDSWGDFQKFRYIHDTLITSTQYLDEGSDCYTAYGCLVGGKCICEGYTKAAMLVCERAGLNMLPVMGQDIKDGGDQGHIWNKVMLDGDWYVTDLTWDDPIITDLEDPDSYVCYDYFAITDQAASLRHKADENRYMKVPVCTATMDDFFIHEGLLITDREEAYNIFRRSVLRTCEEGGTMVRVRCADEETYDSCLDWIYGSAEDSDKVFDAIAEGAEAFPDNNYAADGYSVIDGEQVFTITVELRTAEK